MKLGNLTFLLVCFFAVSCNQKPENNNSTPSPLFLTPKTIKVNFEGGYSINPITNQPIEPIYTKLGDTLQTGVPFVVEPTIVSIDTLEKPKSIKLNTESLPRILHQNYRNIIPKNLPNIKVDVRDLVNIKLGKNATDNVLLSYMGDTITTGKPIPAIGDIEKITQPTPISTLAPNTKEHAVYDIQYLDVEQNFPSSYVQCIMKDSRGNLWMGTMGGGLIKYNGSTVTQFTTDNGLKNNEVYAILEDKESNIWIGLYGGGLVKYDGNSITSYIQENSLNSNSIQNLYQDSNGFIWVASDDKGLSRFDGKTFMHFSEAEGLLDNDINFIIEDKNKNLWFATANQGVAKFDGKSFTYLTEKDGLVSNNISTMLEDKNGNLWFCSNGFGVSKFDGQSLTNYTIREGLSSNNIMSVFEDSSGDIWFGTLEAGLNKYDGESFTHFSEKIGLSNDIITSIIEDNVGNLWLGTLGGGVNKLNKNSFKHFSTKEGLSHNRVFDIIEDKNQNLWFGTWGGGVNLFDEKSFTHFTEKSGLDSNSINKMLLDKKGNIWICVLENGVFKYDGKNFTKYSTLNGLAQNDVEFIYEDRKGDIWFAMTGAGLSKFDGEYFSHYFDKEEDLIAPIGIFEDSKGDLWIGTMNNGLFKFDGKSFTVFSEKEGLLNNINFAIKEDKIGNLWFGNYQGGLTKFNGTHFTHFTDKEGLAHKHIWSILPDNNNNIWVGTETGLTLIETVPQQKSFDKQEYAFYAFKKTEGLKGIDFLFNAAFIDSKNRAWWGSKKSLMMVDLNNFVIPNNTPKVYLNQIDINQQFLDYRNLPDSIKKGFQFNGVQKFENYPLNLVLPYFLNHLTFHFNGLDWSSPTKVQYSYRILNLNPNWSAPKYETKAEYRNLPSGKHTFQVRAIGLNGVWSEPFEYTFFINPPWWKTWWAYFMYVILFFITIAFYSKWRERKLTADNEKLEQTVSERTEELVQKNIVVEKQKQAVEKQKAVIEKEKQRSEELLLNILPYEVAEELKAKGSAEAKLFDDATVLFTDFKGFTAMSETLSPRELVNDLNHCFSAFDRICGKYGIEKIKTIGDAYMAAGGLPTPNATHAKDVVKAALEICEFIEKGKADKIANNLPFFEIRIGINTGPLVAGIVGVKKFQYDIWGDTVNTAARMESNGEVGKVNISQATYELLKDNSEFVFESRGKIEAKGKGEMEMWFVSVNSDALSL